MRGVFERFTDRARRAVVLAQEESRRLDHNYIGTEHLLLGVLAEDESVGARVLTGLGVSLDAARAEVEEIIGRGDTPAAGHVPFTPRAKKVLEMALREALTLGHNYIGTEHILLGLIREGEGVAAQVLVKLGAALGPAREGVVALLAGDEGLGGRRSGGGESAETVVLSSLRTENQRLRQEVDRLRTALGRLGAGGEAERKCSFCGKLEEAVAKLVAGPGVYICDECIVQCNEILSAPPDPAG